jgi:hypothetical protein
LAVALRVYLREQDRTQSSSFDLAQPSIRRIGPGNLSLIRRPRFAAGEHTPTLNRRAWPSRCFGLTLPIARLEGAIADLKLGLESQVDAATGDLAGDLMRALGPQITVSEIEGARTILALMLAALPPKISLGPGRH